MTDIIIYGGNKRRESKFDRHVMTGLTILRFGKATRMYYCHWMYGWMGGCMYVCMGTCNYYKCWNKCIMLQPETSANRVV